jgi:ribosomal protein S21
MAKTIIQVTKNTNENNATLLRRFSRKVMDAGIIHQVKNGRYSTRDISKLSQKTVTLRKLARRKEVEKLKKLGKMKDREHRQTASK